MNELSIFFSNLLHRHNQKPRSNYSDNYPLMSTEFSLIQISKPIKIHSQTKTSTQPYKKSNHPPCRCGIIKTRPENPTANTCPLSLRAHRALESPSISPRKQTNLALSPQILAHIPTDPSRPRKNQFRKARAEDIRHQLPEGTGMRRAEHSTAPIGWQRAHLGAPPLH